MNKEQHATRSGFIYNSSPAALGLAVQAQLYAAHEILVRQAILQTIDLTNSVELDDDPDDIVVHLVEMHAIESIRSRKDWLKELGNINVNHLDEIFKNEVPD